MPGGSNPGPGAGQGAHAVSSPPSVCLPPFPTFAFCQLQAASVREYGWVQIGDPGTGLGGGWEEDKLISIDSVEALVESSAMTFLNVSPHPT